jgi:hypothetical protein
MSSNGCVFIYNFASQKTNSNKILTLPFNYIYYKLWIGLGILASNQSIFCTRFRYDVILIVNFLGKNPKD